MADETKPVKKGKTVKVRVIGGIDQRTKEVLGQPLHEDGVTYQPGQEFETTEERAAALAGSVTVVNG